MINTGYAGGGREAAHSLPNGSQGLSGRSRLGGRGCSVGSGRFLVSDEPLEEAVLHGSKVGE